MGRRHLSRELTVQILFQLDVTDDDPGKVLPAFWNRSRSPDAVMAFTEHLVRGTWEHRRLIDAVLQRSSEHWKIRRMPIVDRNVLRMATFELLNPGEVPAAVIIDEAIEVAKRYGNEDSGSFVNGVLDGVRKRLEAGELVGPAQLCQPPSGG